MNKLFLILKMLLSMFLLCYMAWRSSAPRAQSATLWKLMMKDESPGGSPPRGLVSTLNEPRAQPKGNSENLLFFELLCGFIFNVFLSRVLCYLLFRFAYRNLVL